MSSERAWKAGAVGTTMRLTRDDVIYTPLPLYHAAAAGIGLSSALANGFFSFKYIFSVFNVFFSVSL